MEANTSELTKEMISLKNQNVVLMTQLSTEQAEHSTLKVDVEREQTRYKELAASIGNAHTALKESIERDSERLAQQDETIEKLEASLAQVRAENERLNSEVIEVSALQIENEQNKKYKQMTQDVEGALVAEQAASAALKKALDEHVDEVAKLKDKLSETENNCSRLKQELEATQEGLNTSLSEAETIKREELDELRHVIRESSLEVEALRSQLSNEKRSKEEVVQQLNAQQENVTQLKSVAMDQSSLEQELEMERKTVQRLQEDLDVSNQIKESLERLIEEEQRALATEKERYEQARAQFEDKLQSATKANETAQHTKAEGFEKDFGVQKAAIERLQRELLHSQQEMALSKEAAAAKASALAEQLDEANVAIAKLQHNSKAKTDLEEELQLLTRRLEDAQATTRLEQKYKGDLEKEVEILTKQLADCKLHALSKSMYDASDFESMQNQLTAANERADDAESTLLQFQGKYADLLVAFTDATSK